MAFFTYDSLSPFCEYFTALFLSPFLALALLLPTFLFLLCVCPYFHLVLFFFFCFFLSSPSVSSSPSSLADRLIPDVAKLPPPLLPSFCSSSPPLSLSLSLFFSSQSRTSSDSAIWWSRVILVWISVAFQLSSLVVQCLHPYFDWECDENAHLRH